MTSSGVNLFHLPTEPTTNNEVKFSPSTGDGSEDEDYSASLSAVLRQRRASVRRSRKGRARRSSSPFLPDETRSRRRSSVFTTSSGDTAISIDDQPVVTQEQIFENIHLHKEVLGSVKQQPLGMRRKLKIVHQAKGYIKRHEGQLQERLAQSKSTRDIYARFNILLATKWQQLKREAANTSNLLIPWELRIKEIESHFGSVVASYFTFLRWLFWVNLVIGFILLVFVIIPEYLTANPAQDGERKVIMEDDRRNATNLLTLWEFEGVLKYSPIFYGYYSNVERPEYRMPLAYFLTGLVVYIYSFVAILRKMAENSRMSKLSEKEDECIFSWKLFTGWDFMIGNAETAHNRIASIILGFKEALLEEAEKKKNLRNWRIISLRAIVNIGVIILLAVSAYAVVTVVSRSDDSPKIRSWWRENETTTVVTVISITFPVFFELLGLLEHYHPRKQLRLQLARIMLLNLLNLYSLIFALFSKIEGMSKELVSLQPHLYMNVTIITESPLNVSEPLETSLHRSCFETTVPCLPCDMLNVPVKINQKTFSIISNEEQTTDYNLNTISPTIANMRSKINVRKRNLRYTAIAEDLIEKINNYNDANDDGNAALLKEIERIRNLSKLSSPDDNNETLEIDDNEAYDFNYDFISSTDSTSLAETDVDYEYSLSDTDLPNSTPISTSETSSDFSSVTSLYSTETTEQIFSSDSTLNVDLTSLLISSTDSYTTGYTYPNKVTTPYDTSHTITDEMSSLPSSKSTSKISLTYLTTDEIDSSTATPNTLRNVIICPDLSFNCSINCGNRNITQIIFMSNCTIVDIRCYVKKCNFDAMDTKGLNKTQTNITMVDLVYTDHYHRKMYNLTITTKKKLLKLCWETMFGQELVKLTMMDLVFVLLGTLFLDFFRALFVRYMNKCWCWDLEKKFPEYGDFKIAENILHLINNQGMVWMGMFFSPGLVVLNVFKLMIMMYLRSWAVMTCNVPHEVVFRVSKSNNFYLALLLTMLFLCVLPVGYTIVWVTPSWHCGPFSEYEKIYKILTSNIYKVLPKSLNFTLEYIASPAIVIPLLVLLILIIYYLTSLTNSLREANNDLKIQLRRERTEERRKMFQLADTRRRAGSSSIDNTPFARWKRALPSLPLTKSIDSDDRKPMVNDTKEIIKTTKKKGGIFAKIVGLAIDKKTNEEPLPDVSACKNNIDEETDTDFHESLPKEVLKIKDITFIKKTEVKKKSSVEFKTEGNLVVNLEIESPEGNTIVNNVEDNGVIEKRMKRNPDIKDIKNNATDDKYVPKKRNSNDKCIQKKQSSESSNLSKQTDSIGSVIPVITISTTESDDEVLQTINSEKNVIENKGSENKKEVVHEKGENKNSRSNLRRNRNFSDLKSLQRQSSVDSINENKSPKEKKTEDIGHKYQYSL
ncbi:transmembrane channel-like protein [Vanessa cardui]|uniref:transmembrane channel-like protein n=1 Tax=Vanessa cardui TaxID=171605 RepID=UPI001F137379|nr:transmembrane channel-like protein [Vanessa cardui]